MFLLKALGKNCLSPFANWGIPQNPWCSWTHSLTLHSLPIFLWPNSLCLCSFFLGRTTDGGFRVHSKSSTIAPSLLTLLLCWVFLAARGLSRAAVHGGTLRCMCGPAASHELQSAGSADVAHGFCSSAACGILPDQGLNPCTLHWEADSCPLYHQGSP